MGKSGCSIILDSDYGIVSERVSSIVVGARFRGQEVLGSSPGIPLGKALCIHFLTFPSWVKREVGYRQ